MLEHCGAAENDEGGHYEKAEHYPVNTGLPGGVIDYGTFTGGTACGTGVAVGSGGGGGFFGGRGCGCGGGGRGGPHSGRGCGGRGSGGGDTATVDVGTTLLTLKAVETHAGSEEGDDSFEEKVEKEETTGAAEETVGDY